MGSIDISDLQLGIRIRVYDKYGLVESIIKWTDRYSQLSYS